MTCGIGRRRVNGSTTMKARKSEHQEATLVHPGSKPKQEKTPNGGWVGGGQNSASNRSGGGGQFTGQVGEGADGISGLARDKQAAFSGNSCIICTGLLQDSGARLAEASNNSGMGGKIAGQVSRGDSCNVGPVRDSWVATSGNFCIICRSPLQRGTAGTAINVTADDKTLPIFTGEKFRTRKVGTAVVFRVFVRHVLRAERGVEDKVATAAITSRSRFFSE